MDAAAPDAAGRRAEILRRILLGLVTALLVARPLVLGEDPGLLTPLSGSAGLVISLLWLVAAVGWAAWRAWSRQGAPRVDRVETGLLVVTALVFVSAAVAARYQHPAWLIAWEWGLFAVVFGLVRRLPRTPTEKHSLLAVLLASLVSLSAYAVYQYAVELPMMRERYGTDPEKLRQEMVGANLGLETDDAQLEVFVRRLQENNVFATFAHPNTFAGYLALLLPAAVGVAVYAGRQRSWRSVLAAAAALLAIVALGLTHSRGAILGSAVVGLALLVLVGRGLLGRHKVEIGVALAVVGVAGFLLVQTGPGSSGLARAVRSASLRSDYWTATWAMVNDHPWLGVGPGNFSRYYPRYMLPTAFEKILDPHNFALEMWANCGIFALLALLAVLGLCFWKGVVLLRSSWSAADEVAPPQAADGPEIRWEFYLGGMAGLLLAFLLRAPGMSADELLIEGLIAGARAVLWFAAFALFDGLPIPGRLRSLTLLAGVAAVFVNLLVSGGLFSPSLAQLLWAAAALALNVDKVTGRARSWVGEIIPVPIVVAVSLGYLLFIFYPVTSCASDMEAAHRAGLAWQQVVVPRLQEALEKSQTPEEKVRAVYGPSVFLKDQILMPLLDAVKDDPGNAAPLVELAAWYGEEWQLYPGDGRLSDGAVRYAIVAQRLDPEGKEGYLAEYRLRVLFAQRARAAGQAQEQYGLAARALRRVVDQDPTEARLRYLLADVLYEAGDAVQGRRQAEEAAALDQVATSPGRHLTDPQREQVRKWIGPAS